MLNTNATRCDPAAFDLIHSGTKTVWISTYTLSIWAIAELNRLEKLGLSVKVITAKWDKMFDRCKFPLKHHRMNHTKIWLIDDDVYVGSTNLVDDTITNLMFKITLTQDKKDVRRFFDRLWNGDTENRTYILGK